MSPHWEMSLTPRSWDTTRYNSTTIPPYFAWRLTCFMLCIFSPCVDNLTFADWLSESDCSRVERGGRIILTNLPVTSRHLPLLFSYLGPVLRKYFEAPSTLSKFFQLDGLYFLRGDFDGWCKKPYISHLPTLEIPIGGHSWGGQRWVCHSSELPTLIIFFCGYDLQLVPKVV